MQLNYEISAPSCLDIDGDTGIFIPDVATNQVGSECGNCLCYTPDGVHAVNGGTFEVVADECNPTPCSRNVSFYLMCDRQAALIADDNPNTELCCQDIKLLVAFDDSDVAGPRPRPTNICRDLITADGLLLANLVELRPIACTCDPFGLVYDLSDLAFLCTSFFSGGPCDGQPDCCTPTACDFTGAILTVG